MRILTITNSPLDPSSGSGQTVLHFSAGLRDFGHQVTVLEPNDFEICRRIRRGVHVRQTIGAAKFAAEELARHDYNIVECYGAEFWLLAKRIIATRRRTGRNGPIVVLHTNGLELAASDSDLLNTKDKILRKLWESLTYRYFAKASLINCDYLVTLSRFDRDFASCRGFVTENCSAIVAPGLDQEFLGRAVKTTKERVIGFTGSWIKRKGIDCITSAITQLLITDHSLRFEVCGAANQQQQILSAFPAAIRDRIYIHKQLAVAELAKVMDNWMVFLFPSFYEGYGIALAEAMACGCAVVTTPTGLGYELQNGVEGLLVSFDNFDRMVTNIVAALRLLLNNPVYCTELAVAGQCRVQSLTWRSAITKIDSIYRRILESQHIKNTRITTSK